MIEKPTVEVNKPLIDKLFLSLEIPEICGDHMASQSLVLELINALLKAEVITLDQFDGMVANARSRIAENLEMTAHECDFPASSIERVKREADSVLDQTVTVIRQESK